MTNGLQEVPLFHHLSALILDATWLKSYVAATLLSIVEALEVALLATGTEGELQEVKKHQQVHSILMKGGSNLGSIKPGSVEAGSIKAGPIKPGSVEAGPIEAGSIEAGPIKADSIQAGCSKAGPVKAGPIKAYRPYNTDAVMPFDVDQHTSDNKTVAKVMFKSPHARTVSIQIMCVHGDFSNPLSVHYKTEDGTAIMRVHSDFCNPLSVHYKTEDGTAVAGLNYEPVEGVLKFAAHEDAKEVEVELLDAGMGVPDVSFYLTITPDEDGDGSNVVILQKKCLVNIVHDEAGSILSFELPSIEVSMSSGKAEVVVESKKIISVPVVEKPDLDPQVSLDKFSHKVFKVVLHEPTGGAQLGDWPECRVFLVPGPAKGNMGGEGGKKGFKAFTKSAMVDEGQADKRQATKGQADTGQGDKGQADKRQATKGQADTGQGDKGQAGKGQADKGQADVTVEGSSSSNGEFKDAIMTAFDEGDESTISCFQHSMNTAQKLLSAFMPPSYWKGGYPSFVSALGMLAGLMPIWLALLVISGLYGWGHVPDTHSI
eukprot:gene18458-24940_t